MNAGKVEGKYWIKQRRPSYFATILKVWQPFLKKRANPRECEMLTYLVF